MEKAEIAVALYLCDPKQFYLLKGSIPCELSPVKFA